MGREIARRIHIPLRDLLDIHENGATIKKEDGSLIRIPPRPALQYAYQALLAQRGENQKETSEEVQAAIQAYINEGERTLFNKLEKLGRNKDNLE